MIFNGTSKDYIKVLRGRDRPAWASRTREITERNRLKKTRVEPRIITVPVLIRHSGFSDLQRKKEDMAEWLVFDEPKKLEFVDDHNRYYMALINNEMDIEEFIYWGEGEIEFICPTPFKFGETHTLSLIYSLQKHEIKGQLPADWKTRTVFTRPSSRYELRNGDGQTIRLNYEFIEGDVLEIDYATRDIKLNGNDLAMALSIQSEWFELPVGEVYLEATHETEMTYTERYY